MKKHISNNKIIGFIEKNLVKEIQKDLVNFQIINERDFDEVPALLLAIERSRIDMVLFLLEQGARVNLKDQENRTALSLAVFKDDPNLIKTLISLY